MNTPNQQGGNDLVPPELWHHLPEKFSMTDLVGTWKDNSTATTPAVNIRDLKDAMYIEVALPGVNKEQLRLQVNGNSLHVTGKPLPKNQEDKEKYFTREFNYSVFSRSIPLPEHTDSEKISASCKDGILNIVVPRATSTKTKSRIIKID